MGASETPPPPAGRRRRWLRRLAPLALLAVAAGIVFALDLHTYLRFEALREHREALTDFVAAHAVLAAVAYVLVYAVSTALSLPGGAVLSVAGGFLFGGLLGGGLVVIGATAGATLIFIAARTVLGDVLRERAGPWLATMRAGFQRNALSYLLTLRLIPLFPFFVVNIVPAFLDVRLRTYVVATFFGIIPGALVFTFAGAGIGVVLDSGEEFHPSAILTPQILIALTGLGLLTLASVLYRRWRGKDAGSPPAEDPAPPS